jgi:hypothetical protein
MARLGGGKPNVNQKPAAMLTDRAKNLNFAGGISCSSEILTKMSRI